MKKYLLILSAIILSLLFVFIARGFIFASPSFEVYSDPADPANTGCGTNPDLNCTPYPTVTNVKVQASGNTVTITADVFDVSGVSSVVVKVEDSGTGAYMNSNSLHAGGVMYDNGTHDKGPLHYVTYETTVDISDTSIWKAGKTYLVDIIATDTLLNVSWDESAGQAYKHVGKFGGSGCTPHASEGCDGNAIYSYDLCHNKENLVHACSLSEMCLESGSSAECVHSTICNTDSDCGTDGYTGTPFCYVNPDDGKSEVHQDYITYKCKTPGAASCSNSTELKLKMPCATDQTCSDTGSGGVCLGPNSCASDTNGSGAQVCIGVVPPIFTTTSLNITTGVAGYYHTNPVEGICNLMTVTLNFAYSDTLPDISGETVLLYKISGLTKTLLSTLTPTPIITAMIGKPNVAVATLLYRPEKFPSSTPYVTETFEADFAGDIPKKFASATVTQPIDFYYNDGGTSNPTYDCEPEASAIDANGKWDPITSCSYPTLCITNSTSSTGVYTISPFVVASPYFWNLPTPMSTIVYSDDYYPFYLTPLANRCESPIGTANPACNYDGSDQTKCDCYEVNSSYRNYDTNIKRNDPNFNAELEKQPGAVVFAATLKDPMGVPVPGATITFTDDRDPSMQLQVVTDSNGKAINNNSTQDDNGFVGPHIFPPHEEGLHTITAKYQSPAGPVQAVISKIYVTDGPDTISSFDVAAPYFWNLPDPMPISIYEGATSYDYYLTPLAGMSEGESCDPNCYEVNSAIYTYHDLDPSSSTFNHDLMGQPGAIVFTATLKDSNGDPVPGATVTFADDQDSSMNIQVVTDDAGIASNDYSHGEDRSTAGPYVFTANTGGLHTIRATYQSPNGPVEAVINSVFVVDN